MYDPKVGRWLSQDPLGFATGDADLYRYVGNGPTDRTDPSGLEPRKDQLVGSATEMKPLEPKKDGYTLEEFLKATGAGDINQGKAMAEYGCVGVCALYLMSGNQLTKLKGTPENHDNVVGPWLSFMDAVALKGVPEPKVEKDAGPKELGPDDKYIIFAILGDWNEKKLKDGKPELDDNGKLKDPSDFLRLTPTSIDEARRTPGMIWDYAVYQPKTETWVGANYGKPLEGLLGPQSFYTRTTDEIASGFKENLAKKEHKAVVYYAFIVKPTK